MRFLRRWPVILLLCVVALACLNSFVFFKGLLIQQRDIPVLGSFLDPSRNDEVQQYQKRIAELEALLETRAQGIAPTEVQVRSHCERDAPVAVRRNPRETEFERLVEEWAALHRRIVNGSEPERFLQCLTNYGLGNKIQVAISCALYAVITRRALVLSAEFVGLESSQMPLHHPVSSKVVEPDSKWLMCVNFTDHDKEPWIRLRGVWNFDYFASMLWYNPTLGLLNKLPPNFFQILFRAVFTLQPAFQQRLDEFKRQHFGRYTIGIHLREQIKKFDPNHGRIPQPSLRLNTQAAQTLAAVQTVVPPEEVVWFVACENVETIHAIQRQFPNTSVVYLPFAEGQRAADDAVMTFMLLGECDDIITTDTSTFATNAAARTNKIPVMCNAKGFCVRKLTAQPSQIALVPPQIMCHDLYTSVDNEPGFFLDHYDGQTYAREREGKIQRRRNELGAQQRENPTNLTLCAELLDHCVRGT